MELGAGGGSDTEVPCPGPHDPVGHHAFLLVVFTGAHYLIVAWKHPPPHPPVVHWQFMERVLKGPSSDTFLVHPAPHRQMGMSSMTTESGHFVALEGLRRLQEGIKGHSGWRWATVHRRK